MSEPPKWEAPWTQPNGNSATYNLHCHCGTIRLNMTVSPPLYASETTTSQPERYTAIECDCSHCQRHGYIAAHPLAENVEFIQGVDDIKEYWFGPKKFPHWLCGKCGCAVATDIRELSFGPFAGSKRYSINLRMLKDFEYDNLQVKRFPGMKAMPPKYEV